MHPLDTNDRRELVRQQGGLGMCNITKCCTEVCPEHIKITDNAIIPLKERVVDAVVRPGGLAGPQDPAPDQAVARGGCGRRPIVPRFYSPNGWPPSTQAVAGLDAGLWTPAPPWRPPGRASGWPRWSTARPTAT